MAGKRKAEFYVRVVKNGRITIPSQIRHTLGIKDGSVIKVIVFEPDEKESRG
ncbi:AbrB/MazE/SpoVT family DNA-binding domain-containing protein [Thermococcus celericrescens]|uniref:AbrB/MazE/SpoVT family DNA-binding domain-containing protein n=1 Tax=Thermococcus celericrescens TaxID=227598 RepID=UPI0009FB4D98|nr:AbrB/MazE/SpoVT family DNA-binding domain-containing protein [Thermococcus celericrescens]